MARLTIAKRTTTKLLKPVLSVAAILVLTQLAAARPKVQDDLADALLDGKKIINVVDDFLGFWEQAKGKRPAAQRRLFTNLVEKKHPDYFERAVYHNATAQERQALVNHFLSRVPTRLAAIRDFNKTASAEIRAALLNFKERFPQYQQKGDIYLGLSLFMFDGSVRAVQNDGGVPDTLCLGADVLADYSIEQVQIALAHEFFHLHHFNHLFAHPSLSLMRTPHLPLVIEGLAVAGAEQVYPSQTPTTYLHFTDKEFAEQREELSANARRFLQLIRDNAAPERYEQWFSSEPAEAVPPRAGYLLGYEIVRRLMLTRSIEDIIKMTPLQLREHVEEQLTAIAAERVLLIASGS